MRTLLFVILTAGLAGCASTPKESLQSVTIEAIKPRYIEAQQFKRIGEYWSGSEVTGGRLILRSTPEARDGYYFVLVLDKKIRRLPRGTTITAEVDTPASAEMQTDTFILPSDRPKTREIFVGLTGADWPVRDAVPGAWRFTIKTPNGDLLGQKQSYLWEL